MADERDHTAARGAVSAARTRSSVAPSIERIVRYNVESDATAPNSVGWARSASMSEQASPPPASMAMACTSTVPRSWRTPRRVPVSNAVDSAGPSPIRSAKLANACNPT